MGITPSEDLGLGTNVFAGSWGNAITSGLESLRMSDSLSWSASSMMRRGETDGPAKGDERNGFLPGVKLRRRAASEPSEDSVMEGICRGFMNELRSPALFDVKSTMGRSGRESLTLYIGGG